MLPLQTPLQPTPTPGLWVGSATSKQCSGSIRQLAVARILTLIEGAHLLQQLHRIKLIHRPGIELITSTHGIPRQAKEIAKTQSMSTQQIGLKSDPVAITTGHLQHRLKSAVLKQTTDSQAAHTHHGPTAVRHIDGVNMTPQKISHGQSLGGIPSPRRHHFRRKNLLPGFNRALERRSQSLSRESG